MSVMTMNVIPENTSLFYFNLGKRKKNEMTQDIFVRIDIRRLTAIGRDSHR